MASPFRSQDGFTYIAALVMVVIMGIMLGVAGQSWRTILQRDREEELIFRGIQYRRAIERWNKPRPGQHVATPLGDLKSLLKDPRSAQKIRYLRKIYTDPITGKDFALVKDPAKGIIGVASTSNLPPLKQDNFPEEWMVEFPGKPKYSDWKFTYEPDKQKAAKLIPGRQTGAGITSLPTGTTTTTSPR